MPETILIIDAEPVVRTVVTKILERAGYAVHSTDDVQIALETIKTSPPALVLTNVFLPGITGHDAMRLFKDRCPGVPVLMVSGLPDARPIRDWIGEDGFDAFPKPFAAHELVDKVRQVINRSKERNSSAKRD